MVGVGPTPAFPAAPPSDGTTDDNPAANLSPPERRRAVVWAHYKHARTHDPAAFSSTGEPREDHSYTCNYCDASLVRNGRDIGAPALVTHSLTCAKCPPDAKALIAADSKGKKAAAYLASLALTTAAAGPAQQQAPGAADVQQQLPSAAPVGADADAAGGVLLPVQKQRSIVWEHYAHTKSLQAAEGEDGDRREDHCYACKYCAAALRRNGRDIGAPALITHSLTCTKCPPAVKLEIAKASQGKKARTYLAAHRGRPGGEAVGRALGAKSDTAAAVGAAARRDAQGMMAVPAVFGTGVAAAAAAAVAAVAPPRGLRGGASSSAAAPPAGTGGLSDAERQELDVLLASFVIGERLSVSCVESPFLTAFIEKIGPAYARGGGQDGGISAGGDRCLIPTRCRLAGSLLEKVYHSVQRAVEEREGASCGLLSLAFDATAMARRQSMNVLANLPEGVDIFRECVWTGEDAVTAEYMADIMMRHVESVGVEGVCAIASDNTQPSVLQARRIVCEKYPSIMDVGDEPHCVHLLVEDLVKIVPEFNAAFSKSKDIIRFIKAHADVEALHQNAARELGCPSKIEACPESRHAYFEQSLRQLLSTEAALQAIVSNNFSHTWATAVRGTQEETDSRIFHIIRNPQTWEEFRSVCAYAKPLSTLIDALESNHARFADVLALLTIAYDAIQSLLNNMPGPDQRSVVAQSSHNEVIAQCRKRLFGVDSGSLVVLLRPEHVSAAVLDPLFRPPNLSQEHLGATATVIDKFYREDAGKRALARQQLSSYALKEDCFNPVASSGLIWEASVENAKLDSRANMQLRSETPRTSAIQWWKLYGAPAPELQKLAIALASTSAQAVSAGRSFGIQKLVHTKQQAALGASTVDMLQYCYFNLRSLKNLPAVKRDETEIDDLTMEFLLASSEGQGESST